MSELLTVSSVPGVTGVISSFLLFYFLRERGLSEDLIRTMLFLKLIIAGHSTLYVTRTAGWFWQPPYPYWLLMGATFGTEILGTIVAVYGIFVTLIGWEFALWIWLYALSWFVINDAVKAATCKLLLDRESVSWIRHDPDREKETMLKRLHRAWLQHGLYRSRIPNPPWQPRLESAPTLTRPDLKEQHQLIKPASLFLHAKAIPEIEKYSAAYGISLLNPEPCTRS